MRDHSSVALDELVRICATSGEAGAWEELVRRVQPVIAATVMRTAASWTSLSRPLIDDLVQESYLKLCADGCRLLRNFREQSEGSFLGFLKVVTANVVRDHFKTETAAKRGSGLADTSLEQAEIDVPSRVESAQPEHAVLLNQIDDALARSVNNSRDRLVFWLYYRGGLTARDISSLPGISLSTKGVESLLHRITNSLKTLLLRKAPEATSPADEGIFNE